MPLPKNELLLASRRLLSASLALAVFLVPAAAPRERVAAARPARHSPERPYCHHRLFTVKMAERAASLVYRGTRKVTRRNLEMLTHIDQCQRNRAAERFVYGYYQRHRKAWEKRVYEAAHPWQGPIQSTWYDDGSSPPAYPQYHETYSFAACGSGGFCVPPGTRIEFCSEITGACVTGIRDDSGPYAGADVDVNQNMAAVLGEQDPSSPGRVPLRWRYP